MLTRAKAKDLLRCSLSIALLSFSVWISAGSEFQPISILGYIYSGTALNVTDMATGV
jgi:hypothetical protein